jgi:hypothetical protein
MQHNNKKVTIEKRMGGWNKPRSTMKLDKAKWYLVMSPHSTWQETMPWMSSRSIQRRN